MHRRRAIPAILIGLTAAWFFWPQQPPGPATAPAQANPAVAPAPATPTRGAVAARRDGPWTAAAPDAAPRAMIACPVPPEALTEADRWRMVLRAPTPDGDLRRRPLGGTIGPEQRAAGVLLIPADLAPATGWLDLPGWARAEVTLHPDGCAISNLQRAATLTGRVKTPPGVGGERIVVLGCGARTETDSDGGFLLEAEPEPCTLRAFRQDGLFAAWSAPVDVTPGAGDEILIDLDLPPYRVAGVGAGLRDGDAGAVVSWVKPGSPAEAAGLLAGDVVVGLDELDVSGWSTQEVVPTALGPDGTEVTWRVLRGDEELTLTLTRQVMDAP